MQDHPSNLAGGAEDRARAARRLEQQGREWVARLERLIVDDIYPYGVDQVEHAKEYRLVADMIRAGR